MKTSMKFFIAIVCFGLFLQSCHKENLEEAILIKPESIENVDEVVELGTVSLKTFVKDLIEFKTGKQPPVLENLLDEMVVQIKEHDFVGIGTVVVNASYNDLPSEIPLIPGSYSILVSNYSFSPVRFDTPVHGSLLENFSVTAGLNTELELELALMDVAVSINFSDDLMLTYPDIEATVDFFLAASLSIPLSWTAADNMRTGYFNTYTGSYLDGLFYTSPSIFDLTITARGASGTPITITRTYSGVFANQHYNITIEQTAPASASLTVTLGNEDVIEDTITFPN